MIIDAWAQHPTLRHWSDPMFESLRRWTRSESPTTESAAESTIRTVSMWVQVVPGGVTRTAIDASG